MSTESQQEVPEFVKNFESEVRILSPGRINFIGEHTDYNKGYVLPTAINKAITLSFAKNGHDSRCNIYSATYNTSFSFDLNSVRKSEVEWENYVLGVVDGLQAITDSIKGFDCLIESNLPTGAGISSSAALEGGIGFGLKTLFDLSVSRKELAFIGQKAEHTFVGTKCGIMDQFASIMSEAGNVILLDCQTLKHELIPAHFDPYQVVLLNTNVSHNLATSAYNDRVAECAAAVHILQTEYPDIKSLRDANQEQIESVRNKMSEVVYKRAMYIIEENLRVLDAVSALRKNDLPRFGQLMYHSHHGLQHQYEVSCKELDFLVDFIKGKEGVLGGRMMGGGFGGCTINLIHKNMIGRITEDAQYAYKEEFNIDLTYFTAVPDQGTAILQKV